jgi:hypothetical protein
MIWGHLKHVFFLIKIPDESRALAVFIPCFHHFSSNPSSSGTFCTGPPTERASQAKPEPAAAGHLVMG